MSRRDFQEMLDRTIDVEAELRHIETQIEELETTYLERTWNEGNIVIGWNEAVHSAPLPSAPGVKIRFSPKDRTFSLSSVTSRAYRNLEENVDRQFNVVVEMRFSNAAKKKYRRKKKRTRAPIVLRNRRAHD